jgi:hypothetical protein
MSISASGPVLYHLPDLLAGIDVVRGDKSSDAPFTLEMPVITLS